MKKVAGVVLLVIFSIIFYLVFWPVKSGGEEYVFTVGIGKEESFWGVKIQEGGYYLNKNISIWSKIAKFKNGPDLKWVKILPGMRKEQIGEVVAKVFNREVKNFGLTEGDYFEGVYYPDTYLIPVLETDEQIAKRLFSRFNEKMADLFPKFAEKNIKWTTGLKIASLIQREAGGKDDMGIISGVIWNRLDKGMALQIDATAQYIKGKVDGNWWSHVNPADLKIDSPYNNYLNKGLPPSPICNPGIDAIEAALNPEETDCLFYLHDSSRQIHCAKTYEEHLQNIEQYLR